MRRLCAACVLICCGAVYLASQNIPTDAQAGDFLFRMPPGWNRVEKAGMTFLYAPLPPPGTTTYIALAADEIQTDLRTSFNIEWDGFKKQYRILQGGEIAPQRLASGTDAFHTTAIASDRNGHRWAVVVVGAQYNSRLETVMYMSDVFQPELAATYRDVLKSFLASVKFSSAEPNAPAGAGDAPSRAALPRGKGKFNGIYRAVAQTGDPLSPARRIGYRYVTFFSDGRFMEGIPDQGLEGFDQDAAIKRNPVGWGTYELSGDVGRVVFPPNEYSREPIVWPIKEYSDRLVIHGDVYHLLGPGNDLRLEGTFRRSDYKTTYAATQGITFTSDGRFVDEGVLKAAGVMVRNAAGGEDFDDGAPGRGTYHIANYTLELKYANGVTKRTNFYFEPGSPRTGVREFYLNTWKFARVD